MDLRARLLFGAAMLAASSRRRTIWPARAAEKPIHITLITKDPDNHFWTAMVEGAKQAAKGSERGSHGRRGTRPVPTRTAKSKRSSTPSRAATTRS